RRSGARSAPVGAASALAASARHAGEMERAQEPRAARRLLDELGLRRPRGRIAVALADRVGVELCGESEGDCALHAYETGQVAAFFPPSYTRPMRVCPVCSHENGADARFCSACGAALTTDPPREERKVVTVLFADLVGFTSRAEQLDPEEVRAVLAPYWERLRTELEQRGGTVEKFIGDAVMALFGAPAAHDDDPLRAVGAALAIRDWARDEADVQVRIAVTTGEALVVLGARPAEGEGMAAGDVVNTAARLQAAAPVNGVLVGESTYRATRDVIDYEEREPVVAKGKAEPVRVWEAVNARSRFGMDLEQRTALPLVG